MTGVSGQRMTPPEPLVQPPDLPFPIGDTRKDTALHVVSGATEQPRRRLHRGSVAHERLQAQPAPLGVWRLVHLQSGLVTATGDRVLYRYQHPRSWAVVGDAARQ